MSAPAGCQLVGHWRFVEADLWDRDYLDLCGPATFTGDGHAELLDDGSIEITLTYHNGDEAILKAKRDTSSTAC